MKRGALFFTVDTMVAGLIFTMTVIVVLSFYVRQPIIQDTQIVLNNYVTYITDVKMENFRRNIYIYNDVNEMDPDLSVYQKILKLNVTDNNIIATGFIENFTKILVPPQFGVQYAIDDWIMFTRSTGNEEYTETNLSTNLLTYYIEGDTLIGPKITRISIWS